MTGFFSSTVFWVGFVALVAAALYFVNYLMGHVSNSCCGRANRYPHRVATQLPRELHTKDRDEVLELKDETELQAK